MSPMSNVMAELNGLVDDESGLEVVEFVAMILAVLVLLGAVTLIFRGSGGDIGQAFIDVAVSWIRRLGGQG